ncbi:hypothetical protein EON80_03265 [bacterium]|nr:MAG: hypothetical protein EON80_03265 [bacterium]
MTDAIIGAATVFRENTNTFIGTLNATNAVQRTLNEINKAFGLKGEKPGHSISERHDQLLLLAKDFGGIARRFGRDDIAGRALSEAQAPLPSLHLWNGDWWDGFGVESPWSRVAFQANTFGTALGCWAFGFGLLWLMGQVCFNWLKRKDGNFIQKGTLSRGQVTSSTSFTVWATLGFCALAAYCGTGFPFGGVGWVQSLDLTTNEMLFDGFSKTLPYSAPLLWLLPVPFLMWSRNWVLTRLPKVAAPTPLPVPHRVQLLRRALWLFTLCTIGLTATNGYSLWDGTLFQWLVSPLLAWSCCLVVICFEIYRALRFQTFAFNRLRLGKIHQEQLPNRWLFAGRLLVSTSGVLSVVWSLLFLIGALGVWPIRATMNRTLEHRFAIGEVKWLEEEKARKGPLENQ